MARYNLIKIGDVYLTSDGTETGVPCRTSVPGLDKLSLSKTGVTQYSASGRPRNYLASLKGISLGIVVSWIDEAVFNSIKEIFEASVTDNSSFTLEISGPFGDYELSVVPKLPSSIPFPGEFSGTIIKDVTFNVITT